MRVRSVPQNVRLGPNESTSFLIASCRSRNGYVCVESDGMPEAFTAMFGCLASAHTAGRSSKTVGAFWRMFSPT